MAKRCCDSEKLKLEREIEALKSASIMSETDRVAWLATGLRLAMAQIEWFAAQDARFIQTATATNETLDRYLHGAHPRLAELEGQEL